MTRRAALLLVAGSLAWRASAEPIDRLGVEVLGAETPDDAAFAFERACWRAAVDVASADPVQTFDFAGARWVRLAVDGPLEAVRCLNALERPRRGIDGSFQWFDGFAGGLVVPGGETGERVPDAVFVDPAHALPSPTIDPKRLEALANGDAEALEALKALPAGESLFYVRHIRARGGVQAQTVLEQIATSHPAWRVRREAVAGFSVEVALEKAIAIAGADAAWEVRHAAVRKIGEAAPSALLHGGDRTKQVLDALDDRLQHDAAWEVRREAIWQLPSAFATDRADSLKGVWQHDAEPRVRAVALETLAAIGQVEAKDLRNTLRDASPALRAVAAGMLARSPEEEDVPALWRAMHDDDRLVRIAAAGVLPRIDDPTIGPELWGFYTDEASETDADPRHLATLLDALARRPFPLLPALLEGRLGSPIDPEERRLVARAYAQVVPERSLRMFRVMLDSPDAREKAIAAETAPDAPDVRVKRLALLEDADPDVRASAVIGLCRTPGALPPERAQGVALEPVGLGAVAMEAARACGMPRPEPERWKTRLAGAPQETEHGEEAARWPAIAGIALLLASVLGIKLSQARRDAD